MPADPSLYVISAPSGGGKTSLIRALLQRDPNIRLSVSHTTRPPRPGETDGIHYHFVSETDFDALIAADAFLEHARVYGHRYGTGRAQVEKSLAAGHDVVLDIDWQGAQQVRSAFPRCCTIFILPPSLAELEHRLARRAQDSGEVIRARMQKARSEISHWSEFDFLVINDDFEQALDDLHAIVRQRQPVRLLPPEEISRLLANLLENA